MPDRRQFLTGLALLPGLAAWPLSAKARVPEVSVDHGVAVRGADVVAYFRAGSHVPGQSRHALMWRGAEWHFSSVANRDAFEMDPHAFAPRFGGYCAYAMALGELAPSDPAAFTVHQGRLYLNYSQEVRRLWRAAQARYIHDAEANWPQVLND